MSCAPTLFARVRPGFIAALLLAWFWGQVISVSPELGLTADEVIHVTAGYEYWRHGDYRLQPENGNLPQRLAALPLLWLDPAPVPAAAIPLQRADTWGVGNLFFFHLGNQPGLMLFAARCMIALLGVATGALIYRWARDLWGPAGALVATSFFASSPTVLAHAGLATSDMMASFGFLAALLTGWRMLHRVTAGRVLLFGLALGLLALAKFSAPMFVFVFAALVALRLAHPAPLRAAWGARRWRWRGWRRLPALAGGTCAAAALAYALIWGAYDFRYYPTRGGGPGEYPIKWEYLLNQIPYTMQTPVPEGLAANHPVAVAPSLVRTVVSWAKDHHALPEAYLFGFAHVYTFSKWRPAFFLGEYGTTGWPLFFPVSILLKTPLALLALGLTALVLLLRLGRYERRTRRLWYRLGPLLAFVGIYAAFVLSGNLNIGIRHLLPAECAWCIVGGVLGLAVARAPLWLGVAVVLLFAGANAATWNVRPSYLAFFNRLAGGPDQGYAYLVDSSLDWGQGLPRLGAWLAQHRGADRLYLAYFGSDSPWYEDLRAIRIGDGYFDREPINFPAHLHPGLYAVSATLLQGVYTMAPGPWTEAHEQAYQRRLAQIAAPDRMKLGSDVWFEWDQLRFARLRHFLRAQKPAAQPDPSILVYRLSAADLTEALGYRVN